MIGIKIRNNSVIWNSIFDKATLTYKTDTNKYTLESSTVLSITIKAAQGKQVVRRVVPWTEVEGMTITN